jgi:hypothetical protein
MFGTLMTGREEDAMPATTIEVPPEHVETIRQSLVGRHGHADLRTDIESLLAQIASAPVARPAALTGPRTVLWSVVYDALCMAAEQLAEDFNEYWRGDITPATARSRITDVSACLEILIDIGPPQPG